MFSKMFNRLLTRGSQIRSFEVTRNPEKVRKAREIT